VITLEIVLRAELAALRLLCLGLQEKKS